MKPVTLLMILLATGGPLRAAWAGHPTRLDQLLQDAEMLLKEGDLYEAKNNVRQVLEKEPAHERAWMLMAEIIDEEIARQRETETSKLILEYTDREKEDAIKTWLERSRSYLEIGAHEQAMLAAEKVFLYDAQNLQASELIDQIRQSAIKAGKGERLALERIYRAEVDTRVQVYLEQAENWLREGREGAARLALEKTLLLDPENKTALRMYERYKQRKTPE